MQFINPPTPLGGHHFWSLRWWGCRCFQRFLWYLATAHAAGLVVQTSHTQFFSIYWSISGCQKKENGNNRTNKRVVLGKCLYRFNSPWCLIVGRVFWTVQEKPLRAAQKLFLGGKKRVSRFFNWICLKIGYLIIVQIFFSIRVDLTYVIEKSAPKWPLMPLITIDACQMAGRKNHPPIQERWSELCGMRYITKHIWLVVWNLEHDFFFSI